MNYIHVFVECKMEHRSIILIICFRRFNFISHSLFYVSWIPRWKWDPFWLFLNHFYRYVCSVRRKNFEWLKLDAAIFHFSFRYFYALDCFLLMSFICNDRVVSLPIHFYWFFLLLKQPCQIMLSILCTTF
jgi:hypothetical protein